MYSFIQDSVIFKITNSFNKDKLFAIRVEGHSDKRIPGPNILDNMDLSYQRAKQVTILLEDIIDNSNEIPISDKEKIKKKIRVAGFGSNEPNYKIQKLNGQYFVISIKDSKFKKGPFSLSKANEILFSSNRRVVINIIESGI